jgi:hypothetical protein
MSKAKNYTIQSPNATAVNILRSWIRAAGIPVRSSKVPGFDLTVTRDGGSELEVQVTKRKDETLPGDGIQVLASDITGRSLALCTAAFYRVTDAAGYERRNPVQRGGAIELNEKGNPRKLHYKDEEFLVSIRHPQFRRSPNPSADRWVKYGTIIDKASSAFFRSNFELCARQGLAVDDIKTYARCFTVNFCARHEIPEEETTHDDNERLLTASLKQKFANWRDVLLKKERSTLPDAETVNIGLFGRPDADTEVSPEVEDEIDYDYIAKHCELDTSTPTKRKESAAAKLVELLGSLPHDQMVELLKNAAANPNFDFTTRKEAARQLRLHSEECGSCLPSDDAGIEEDEDLAGADALSADE